MNSYSDLFRSVKDRFLDIFTKMSGDTNGKEWSTHESNIALLECLSRKTPFRPALPAELILQILDQPSRWVCSFQKAIPNSNQTEARPFRVPAGRNGQPGVQVLLSTPAVTEDQLSGLRRIVFTFTSKDQGWSSYPEDYNTYRNTWSWFEVGVRPTNETESDPTRGFRPDEYQRYELQRNRHAGKEPESYRIEYGREDPITKNLKPGDVVDLLACAQFGGWENQVHAASIEMWSFDDPIS